jgi:hypothetical protein
VCLFAVWWPFTATECIFSFLFSLLESPSKTMGNRPSQTFRRGRILSRIPAPSLVLFLVGCCVVSANGGRLKLMPCSSLYFFVAPFAAPNDREKSQRAQGRAPTAEATAWRRRRSISLARDITALQEAESIMPRQFRSPAAPMRGEDSPMAMKQSIRTASALSGGDVRPHLLLYNSANQPTHQFCSLRN